MKTIRLTLTLLVAAACACTLLALAPTQWFRTSGRLDLIIALDTSGSYADQFPTAVDSVKRIIREVLPGDRLAVLDVGPTVTDLASGIVTPHMRADLVRQLVTLRTAEGGGTAFAEALRRASARFEEFLKLPASDGKHRRMLVVFSDCVEFGSDNMRREVALPPGVSVLVVGFRGSKQDTVTMSLMGGDSANDVHLVAPSDAAEATDNLLRTLKKQVHPFRAITSALALVGCLVIAGGIVFLTSKLTMRKPACQRIRLTDTNDPDGSQEFPLASTPCDISVGGGDQLHDFALPVNASCLLNCCLGRDFALSPVNGSLWAIRNGARVEVTQAITILPGDSFILDGREISLQAV